MFTIAFITYLDMSNADTEIHWEGGGQGGLHGHCKISVFYSLHNYQCFLPLKPMDTSYIYPIQNALEIPAQPNQSMWNQSMFADRSREDFLGTLCVSYKACLMSLLPLCIYFTVFPHILFLQLYSSVANQTIV